MPAVSKKQQRFFGIVRAIQKGEQKPTTPETAKAASGMKMKSVKKFAKTKHKGLPEKKVQKEESCGKGMYYCNQRKKCMPIPKGSKVRKDGMLVKESVKDELLSRAEQKRKSFKQFRKDARMAGQKPLKRGEVRKYDSKTGKYVSNKNEEVEIQEKSAAWQRKEGKNKTGGLNEKGRKSYERENPGSDLKAPQPEGGPRKRSFCARMGGVKGPMKKPDGSPTRKALALRKWKC